MGVLTDLIIADKSEAEIIVNDSAPYLTRRIIDASGHNDLTLGILLCILRGKGYDDSVLDEFSLLAENPGNEAWVFEVPKDLIIFLCELNDDNIPNIVSQWLKTDDLQGANYEDLESFIKEFKEIALESAVQQKPILMWASL